jgi:GNAT superfamily N-acetyltransferase
MKIREATRDDAADICALFNEFTEYLRSLGNSANPQFNTSTYLRDGFGDNPAFHGLVAEIDSEIVGYLLYHFGYEVELAIRNLHVIDLYVRPSNRLQGVGQALIERAGEICAAAGGNRLSWFAYSPNNPAFRFYERLGARYLKDMQYMYLPLEDKVSE